MNTKEHLVDWLRDAHAMEMSAISILERQESRLESYPDMLAKVREHVTITRSQAERLEGLLQHLGDDTSMLKDAAGRFKGNMSALMNAAASDEVVKNAIANYTFEQFEIACYRSLIAAADELGETRVSDVCAEILDQEEEMADWLDEHIPTITQQFLERDAADMQSKR
jgi:ferritin-like metal-binding protein YciE